LADAVEKGQNEPIEIFACAPVETGFSKSNASQRAYEGCWLEIGLIICPPTSFSDYRTGASEKIRSTPRKTFFNSIGQFLPRHLREGAAASPNKAAAPAVRDRGGSARKEQRALSLSQDDD
jgi:hypothetical protein